VARANELGDWETQPQEEQQPIGLTEEQLSFTFAVARAQVAAKAQGQYPAPVAAVEAVAKRLQFAA